MTKKSEQKTENTAEELNTLTRLLKEKQRLLQEIVNLSRQQGKYIQNEEIDQLEKLLESKQVRMDKIDRLDREFLRKFTGIKAEHQVQELSELKVEKKYLLELQNTTGLVAETLESAAELDRKNQELMESSHQDLKGRLKRIKRGKRVRANYETKPSTAEGVFLDKKH